MELRRWSLASTGWVLVLTSATSCTSGRCDDPHLQPEELTRSEVRAVPDGSANVLVDLSGALSEAVRVTATFDDDVALDVEVAGRSAACATDPITRYGFDVPPGPLTVEVVSGDDQEASVSFVASGAPRWVVVSLQDGFPVDAEVWTTRPQYG